MKSTLERIDPETIEAGAVTGAATLRLHLERYQFACRFVGAGTRVLDIACGVGYGTELLANSKIAGGPVDVVGVDCSADALAVARGRYRQEHVQFVQADCMEFVNRAGFDTIVSLETVEHLPAPEKFVRHIASQLRPGGTLVLSVPVTPSVDFNRHHLSDFSPRSITRLVERAGLKVVDRLLQVQSFNPFAVLARSEERLQDGRHGLPRFYCTHPRKLALRLTSLLRDGFRNKYLTLACRQSAA